MPSLAVVILTYNEEIHIRRAIDSVRAIASDVIVVDSGSTDATATLATQAGARLLVNPFVTQAQQFRWALENTGIAAEWTMRLDADEYIEADLRTNIAENLSRLPAGINGINLKRKHIFLGRWIRHGGRYPLLMMRIWRTGKGRIEDRLMDEHLFLTEGKTVNFAGGFVDHNLHSLSRFVQKHNDYATREALEVVLQRREAGTESGALSHRNSSMQAALKHLFKRRVYNRIPFTVSAPLYFAYRYIVLLGFLDGRQGAIYHVLQGFWYRFLVGAKIYEIEEALENGAPPAAVSASMRALVDSRLDGGRERT